MSVKDLSIYPLGCFAFSLSRISLVLTVEWIGKNYKQINLWSLAETLPISRFIALYFNAQCQQYFSVFYLLNTNQNNHASPQGTSFQQKS